MDRDQFGLPRPLLNIDCEIMIKALYVGEDIAPSSREALRTLQNETEVTITKSRIEESQNEGIPPSLSSTIEQNRLRLDTIGVYADALAEEARDESIASNVAIATKPVKESRLPRPFVNVRGIESTFLIEVNDRNTSFALVDVIDSEFLEFDSVTFLEERNTIIVETGEDTLSIRQLSRLRSEIGRFDIPSDNVIITCAVREF
jgi:hypothetical protein